MRKRLTSKNDAAVDRVIDANYNRAKEGLRVCEDTARFCLDDKDLTAGYKNIRHELTKVAGVFHLKNIIVARDVAGDHGRSTTPSESARKDVPDIFYANIQRVKESLRVLEEFAKISDGDAAESFKLLRYRIYAFEKKTFERL